MANETRSRSIAMRWRPLQEKEKRRNKRRRKKRAFLYIREQFFLTENLVRIELRVYFCTFNGRQYKSRNNVGDVSSFN